MMITVRAATILTPTGTVLEAEKLHGQFDSYGAYVQSSLTPTAHAFDGRGDFTRLRDRSGVLVRVRNGSFGVLQQYVGLYDAETMTIVKKWNLSSADFNFWYPPQCCF